MGQYFHLVNRDKMEMYTPQHGLKYWEFLSNEPFVWGYLLRKSNESGGGDIDNGDNNKWPNQGRWAGDRVALVGDYDESDWYDEDQYTNISASLYDELQRLADWLA